MQDERRHVHLADALASEVLDGDPVPARARIDALRPLFEEALAATGVPEHAAAFGEVLALDAPEAEAVIARALAIAAPSPRATARLLVVRARARYLLGRFADASADAERARELVAADSPDEPLSLRVLLVASVCDRDTGRLARARQRALDVAARAADLGDHRLETWAILHAASAALLQGDPAAARPEYQRALARARDLGMRRVEALALTNLGNCALAEGDFGRAEADLRTGAERFAAIGDTLLGNKLEVRLARILLERGQSREATELATRAVALAKVIDDRDTAVRATLVLGQARVAEAVELAAEIGFVSLMTSPLEAPRGGLAAPRGPVTPSPSSALASSSASSAASASASASASALAAEVPDAASTLRVAPDAAWFEPPGGARVDLRTRVPLRRVLAHLVARRLHRPDEIATTDDLAEVGWPAERIQVEAARDRVYTTVGMLRKLGLGQVIVRRDGGYALDTTVRVVVAPP